MKVLETIYYMRKSLLALLICLTGVNISCAGTLSQTAAQQSPSSAPVVILYSADWCWWCDKAEKFLVDNNIQYVNRDIEDPVVFKKLEEIAKKLNYKRNLGIVPLFIIGRDVVAGFDPISVMAYLEKAKWSDTPRDERD
jgi:glutaredoxin